MHGLALLLIGLAFGSDSNEVEKDVSEIHIRQFAMPFQIDPAKIKTIKRVRLFVSEDSGKTWKHHKDYKPSDEKVHFSAPRDGLYWFALQVVSKKGKKDPEDFNELVPSMKVYVNSERKTVLKPRKSPEELQSEVEELRKSIEELKRRIDELESAGKGK